MKHRLAQALRNWADRLDHEGAPKMTGQSFTFEKHRGIVFNDKRLGCPLWYYGDADYERAHNEAEDTPPRVDWKALSEGAPPLQPDPNLIVRSRWGKS